MTVVRVDLNLFRVFEAVMRSRSVSGASVELGVTPSAVSHALGRLRQAIDDDLFIYSDGLMVPTARAMEIAPSIQDGLERIYESINAKPFVPETAVRTLRISATDYVTRIILVPLIEHLATKAPQIEIRLFPYNRQDVTRHLDEGRLDLVVGWIGTIPAHLKRTQLLREKEALIVRRGHPLAQGPLTRERLFAFPFVVVELTGSGDQSNGGFLDDRGFWRRVWIDRLLLETSNDTSVGHVAVSVPYYAVVPDLLANSDMVATLPERLARPLVAAGTHCMIELPFPPFEVDVETVWHQRSERDPCLRWLLGDLVEIAERL